MKSELLSEPGANPKRERLTLGAGESCPAAGTTRHVWRGPGSFRRQTWTDGGREDFHLDQPEGGAKLVPSDS